MKISINTLKEIEKHCGSFSICEGIGKHSRTYLRFGYWRKSDLDKISEILGPQISVYEESDYDEDCGWKYFYIIKQS